MYYNYPVYTNGPYGVTYQTYAQTSETRDQFIRRWVVEKYHIYGDIVGAIEDAKTVWNESIKTETK